MVCPVCDQFVRGDVDVVEAHVDACLAHVRLTNEREERRRGGGRRGSADVNGDGDVEWDVDLEGEDDVGIGGVMEGVSFRGACALHFLRVGFGLREGALQVRASTFAIGMTRTSRMRSTSTGRTKQCLVPPNSRNWTSWPLTWAP